MVFVGEKKKENSKGMLCIVNTQNGLEKKIQLFESSYGKCHEACLKMQKEFPELELVKGWYDDIGLPDGRTKRSIGG